MKRLLSLFLLLAILLSSTLLYACNNNSNPSTDLDDGGNTWNDEYNNGDTYQEGEDPGIDVSEEDGDEDNWQNGNVNNVRPQNNTTRPKKTTTPTKRPTTKKTTIADKKDDIVTPDETKPVNPETNKPITEFCPGTNTPHTVVVDAAVEATCSKTGLSEGKHCSKCNQVIVSQLVVDFKAHTEAVVKGTAASATFSGKTDKIYCSVCNKVLKQAEVIPIQTNAAILGMKKYMPIVTYAFPIDGASRVYAYNDSSLSSKSTSYFIDCYTDEITIVDVNADGTGLKVAYPTSSGTRTLWFDTKDIVGVSIMNPATYTAGKGSNTYRIASATEFKVYGVIATNDTCYRLGSRYFAGSEYFPTVYNTGAKTVNGVANVKYRLALTTFSGLKSDTTVWTPGNIIDPPITGFVKNIKEAASAWGIGTTSNAYKALTMMNSKYDSWLTAAQKQGIVIFFFEGVGNNASYNTRMNAMCVVVKNGSIAYINRNSTTFPDYPFNPAKNQGTDMGTVRSGIYNFSTVNHNSQYAALNINSAKTVRFKSQYNYYASTSGGGFNIHHRYSTNIAASSASWVNSAGCFLVGNFNNAASGEYAKFIQAVGLIPSGYGANTKYWYTKSGKVIIDRASFGQSYLQNTIGYPAGAVSLIG